MSTLEIDLIALVPFVAMVAAIDWLPRWSEGRDETPSRALEGCRCEGCRAHIDNWVPRHIVPRVRP